MKDKWVSVRTPILPQRLKRCSPAWEFSPRPLLIWSAPLPLGRPFAGLTKCHCWFHCRHQVTWRRVPSSTGIDWHQYGGLEKRVTSQQSSSSFVYALRTFKDKRLAATIMTYNSSKSNLRQCNYLFCTQTLFCFVRFQMALGHFASCAQSIYLFCPFFWLLFLFPSPAAVCLNSFVI